MKRAILFNDLYMQTFGVDPPGAPARSYAAHAENRTCNCIQCRATRTLAVNDNDPEMREVLLTYAAQIAKKDGVLLSVAIQRAREAFPLVAQAAARQYEQTGDGASYYPDDADADRSPERDGNKLGEIALKIQRERKTASYSEALRIAMEENPELAKSWADISTPAKRR